MSYAITAIRSVIAADADVQSLCNDRVTIDFVPEDSQKPALMLYTVSETSEDCFSGFVGFENARIRLESYGTTRKQADDAHSAGRRAIDGLLGVFDGVWIKGVSQSTGRAYLVDKPNDGTDRWQFRTVQSFEVTYNSF